MRASRAVFFFFFFVCVCVCGPHGFCRNYVEELPMEACGDLVL